MSPPTFQIIPFLLTTDTRIKVDTTWAGHLYIMHGPNTQVKPHCVFMHACMCVCVCCMSSGNRLETAAPIRYRFLFRAQTDTVHNPHCETNSPEPLPGSHLTLSHTHTRASACGTQQITQADCKQSIARRLNQTTNIIPKGWQYTLCCTGAKTWWQREKGA